MKVKDTLAKAIKTCDADISKNDVKRIYSLLRPCFHLFKFKYKDNYNSNFKFKHRQTTYFTDVSNKEKKKPIKDFFFPYFICSSTFIYFIKILNRKFPGFFN